jgi:polysaccharide pyruvyl transferase WcaK-like protein
MKSALKAVIPAPVLTQLRQWKVADSWRRLHRDWDQASANIVVRDVPATTRSLLIFPSDPRGITGAVGDDAMLTAAVEHFRAANPDLQVSVLCIEGRPEEIVRSKGFTPVVIPEFGRFPVAMADLLKSREYDALVAVGADVMDGYYSVEYSTQLLIAADLAARSGMRALFLGFSFNESAAPELEACFARLDPRVTLNLRDRISLARIERFAPVHARLVADSAFTLRPGEVDAETSHWIETEKAAGRQVIGINLHPMLIRHADAKQIGHLVSQMASAIEVASAKAAFSWLLVPHDYRDDTGDGDGICLRPLFDELRAMPGVRSRYFQGTHRAATLKALAGRLDGVVTGRMHLAIASLGMGVPVLCLTYQDKFEGLYNHFDLPREHLLPPKIFDTEGALEDAMLRFLSALPDLRRTVAQEQPRVAELAQTNFALAEGVPA